MILSEILSFQEPLESLTTIPCIDINKLFPDYVNQLVYIRGVVKKVQVKTLTSFNTYYCTTCGSSEYVVQELPEVREPHSCSRKCSRPKWSLDMNKVDTYRGAVYTLVAEGSNYNEKISVYSTNKYPLAPGARFQGIICPRTYYSSPKKTMIEYCFAICESEREHSLFDESLSLPKAKEAASLLLSNPGGILPTLLEVFNDFKGDYLDPIKKAIIYQIISTSFTKSSTVSRDTLNILLVGEPGTGKSSILKRVSELCGTTMVNGSVSTSAGIIAACIKSEKEDGYVLEAGSCLLSDRNVLCIDELDKSKSKTIIEELHEPMEQGTISFNKAGLHLTLDSRVAFLIAMNPEKNLQGNAEKVFKTKYLTNSFLNRIDLLFYIKESEVSIKDSVEMISTLDRAPCDKEIKEWEKKVSVIKSFPDPVVPIAIAEMIVEYYKLLEQKKKSHFARNEITQERFLITMRQREALERLCKSIAKSKLRAEVTLEDAREAIELSSLSIYSLFINPVEQKQPLELLGEAVEVKKDKTQEILSVISTPHTILKISEKTGIIYPEVQMIIKKLMKHNIIYSPSSSYYERIGNI